SHGFSLSTLSAVKRCSGVMPANCSVAPKSLSLSQSAGIGPATCLALPLPDFAVSAGFASSLEPPPEREYSRPTMKPTASPVMRGQMTLDFMARHTSTLRGGSYPRAGLHAHEAKIGHHRQSEADKPRIVVDRRKRRNEDARPGDRTAEQR